MKRRVIFGFFLLFLSSILLVIMNYETKSVTFYWPESSYGEIFQYEYVAEEYYEHKKEYKIEVKNNNGVIEELRIIENMTLPKGKEGQIDSYNKFYQRHKESNILNHDIVNFEYGESFIGEYDSLVMGLVITVNCKEIDLGKHSNLTEFLGVQDILDGNLLPYDLYKKKLLKMGFVLYE